nr:hypothetical protein BaRGS_027347 [Batillaria attramentaria]
MSSEPFHYKRGVGQVFSQPAHIIDPSKFPEEEWMFSLDKEIYPIVIHCAVEEEEHAGHSHIMYAIIEKSPEGSYLVKPLKQKQFVDGLCYLLQEIYGIENKNMERMKTDCDENPVSQEGVPPGYEAISLVEALNGQVVSQSGQTDENGIGDAAKLAGGGQDVKTAAGRGRGNNGGNFKVVEGKGAPGWKADQGEIGGGGQLSAGDMADDEREDSSETEPEPDYEEEEEVEEEPSVISGTLSGQVSPEEIEPLQITERLMLSDTPGSGTEGSSFGSNCSSHALLNHGEPVEDSERKMTI